MVIGSITWGKYFRTIRSAICHGIRVPVLLIRQKLIDEVALSIRVS